MEADILCLEQALSAGRCNVAVLQAKNSSKRFHKGRILSGHQVIAEDDVHNWASLVLPMSIAASSRINKQKKQRNKDARFPEHSDVPFDTLTSDDNASNESDGCPPIEKDLGRTKFYLGMQNFQLSQTSQEQPPRARPRGGWIDSSLSWEASSLDPCRHARLWRGHLHGI
jgi:hypothetical protein